MRSSLTIMLAAACVGSLATAVRAQDSAAPGIESLAEELVAPGPSTVADAPTLPDGSAADHPTDRRPIWPSATKPRPVRRDISMTFLVGSAKLTADAMATLDRFARALVKVANYRPFRIEGHTDRSGGADLNRRLSRARAESVARYLAAKGVDGARMTPRGLGFDQPLPDAVANSPRNRRVEVVAD